jgi:hypothetical protein
LPQFGYFALNGQRESGIERIDGVVAEQSRGKDWFYANGRGFRPDPPLLIRPAASRVERLGDRTFKLLIDWDAETPAPKDLAVFMHFLQPQVSRLKLTGFYGGGQPELGTSQWRGRVTTGDDWSIVIPDDCPPGEYEILVGLYDPQSRGRRYRLLGDEDAENRCRIGKLMVEGSGRRVAGVRLEKSAAAPPLASRLQPNPRPVDFGVAETAGGFRCQIEGDRLVVTPLPDSEPFRLTLRLDKILPRPAVVRFVQALDAAGAKGGEVEFQTADQELSFATSDRAFAYEVRFE